MYLLTGLVARCKIRGKEERVEKKLCAGHTWGSGLEPVTYHVL